MKEMNRELGATFVFSTHDPHLMSHADETFTICDGQLVDHVCGASQC